MKFSPIYLNGAYEIDLNQSVDHRGYFARTFCSKTFKENGLVDAFHQMSTSFNVKRGQIRGMHYQEEPYAETKIVRCTRGGIFDVMVDLRPESPTYLKWYGTELSAQNLKMFYIPKGFAHGFQTLTEDTEILYMMDEFYYPEAARSIPYDSKDLNINWPLKEEVHL